MAGILGTQSGYGGGILGAQQQTPDWANRLGLFSAALKDFAAQASGRDDPGTLQAWQQGQQQSQIRQQILGALNSQDPSMRQQGYQAMTMLGMDPKPFQQQQAQQQLPQLLQSMKPRTESVAALQLDNGASTPAFDYQAPGLNISDAIAQAPPELQGQYAPKLLENQITAEAEAQKPFDLSPGQTRFQGGQPIAALPEKNNPNQPFNADGSPNKAFQDYTRNLKAYEASVSPMNANNNPFGKGMTGHAYALLAAGAKDPKVRATPEYMTAWQILSNPKVDPNTGTIVVPDLSAYQPPDGVERGQGGQPQQRMPSLQAFAPPNPSQADAASAGYANRLADSTSQIDQNEGALTSLGQNMKSRIPLVGNYAVSPEFQKGDQAERNFINAQLRRESGAAIAESEFTNARKQYIPQPGDSKEVLDQKRAARAMAVRNMQLSAGNTLLPPGVIQNASPPRGAPLVPMEQGFGGPPTSPANLPRLPQKASGGWIVKRRN